MKITRDNFNSYIHEYEQDELFYKNIYLYEKEHPETFPEYLKTLDLSFIQEHRIFVPALRNEPWFPYMDEPLFFTNIPGNIILSKHFRYTPIFIHEHEFFEIFCIYDGTASVEIQGIHHQLVTGDILIIPPRTKHSVGIFDDSVAFNILVRGSTFQSTFFPMIADNSALSRFFSHILFQKTEGNYLIFHTGDDILIRTSLQDLYIEFLGRQKYKATYLNTMLIMLWAQLLRYHEKNIESVLTPACSIPMTEILNYLNRNFHTISLSEAAEHFGFSTAHFCTLIKKGTGRTFSQIIKEIKLTQACRALRETSLSIASISELIGYENPEHFMRTFKKNYGITPSQYR
ncbi:MAG: helix-turn-helix domain-containing protein, partial [Lachnospiraceae bacterium]